MMHKSPRALIVFSNSFWMMADKLFRLGLAFITGAIIARHLGPHDYGLLNYAGSFLAVLNGISMLGFDRLIIRDISMSKIDESLIMRTAIFLKITALCVTLILGIILALAVGVTSPTTLLMIALIGSGSLLQFGDILDLSFQAHLDVRRSIPARLVGTTISTLLKIILVYKNFGAITFAAIGIIEGAAVTIIISHAYKISRGTFPSFIPDIHYMKKLFSEGWPIFTALNLDYIYQKYYTIAVGTMMGPVETSYFGIANRLLEIPLMLLVIGTTSFIPDLTRLYHNDKKNYLQKIVLLTEFWTITAVIFSIIALSFSTSMVRLVFSDNYLPAAWLFKWMLIGVIFQANGAFRAIHCTISGNSKVLLKYNAISLIISIAFSSFLIPEFGATGAAVAMSTVTGVNYIAMSWIFPSTRDFSYLQFRALYPNSIIKIIAKLLQQKKINV